ncbi:MAG: hypothetical protein SVT52_00380 [Planctomycetota bacterium]|nr:hypothetical protein [Planctomycetota bacterium]
MAKPETTDGTDLKQLVEQCRRNLRAGRPPLEGLSTREAELLLNRYATFEDVRDERGFLVDSEVVVHSLHTPRPYLHFMASNHHRAEGQWGSFWDQHRGGFSCVDSVQAGRMTSHLDTNYVPTSPEPQDVRDFYVNEAGLCWPMFPVAGLQEDQYDGFVCRFGLDRYKIRSSRNGLACSLAVCVHKELPLELWRLTLLNESEKPRDLSWFLRLRVNVDSYPFYYFVPRVVCEGVLADGALVFLNHDKNNAHSRNAFLASAEQFAGFDMMAEVFDGGVGRAPIPAAVRRGRCFDSLGRQPYAGLIAAVQYEAHLAPGEAGTWTVAYGKCPDRAEQRKKFIAKVRHNVLGRSERCTEDLSRTWRAKVLSNAIRTPDGSLDRYYNVWSKCQARSQARFINALDKVGYRDVLQHLLGVCDFEAPYVRGQLARTLQYQFPDGRAVRQHERFAGGGHDLRLYQDSPVWIPDTLVRCVKETGDVAFLDDEVAFLDEKSLQPSSTERGSVYEHARRAVRSLYEHTGFHGLCKIGYGDWNDALSGIGGGKGVSVWLSCACVYAAKLMAELADHTGREEDRAEFAQIAETMTQRINEHAWDGRWYIYAINGQGAPIGSDSSEEGKIHLNVNTWSLFSGVAAAADRQQQVWDSIEQLATPVGHMLLKPAYRGRSRDEVGRIADQMPGMFENGSIYTHGEAFYLYALACAGESDKWYEQIQKTLPCNLVPDIATGPPHQQSNFFVGPDHSAYGANLFGNFTGSLAWYRRSIEKVVGLIAEFDGLSISPRPPRSWGEYQAARRFRGAKLLVEFHRGDRFAVLLDGRECGGFIPACELAGAEEHHVRVTYT